MIHRIVQDPDAKVKEIPLSPVELKEYQDRGEKLKIFIANMRLELAKVNREVLRYSFAIDEVPGTAELLQYEKRFIELYNQGKVENLYTMLYRHFFRYKDIYLLFYWLTCLHGISFLILYEDTHNQSV